MGHPHVYRSWQKRLEAEATAACLFEFGGFDDDRGQTFLVKNGIERWGHVRRDVAAIDDNAVSHEVVGFVGIEKMNSGPVFVNCGERVGGKGSGKNQGSYVVQRTEAGVEVIAVGVDKLEGDDRNSHFGHCGGEFLNAAAC